MERSVSKLLRRAAERGGIAAAMREWQLRHDDTVTDTEQMDARMREALAVMRDSADKGLDPALRSVSRLTGGNAGEDGRTEAAVMRDLLLERGVSEELLSNMG